MKDPTEIVIIDESHEEAKLSAEERAAIILQQDFDEFKKIRAYVKKNMHKLVGHKVPIEVLKIQNLESHECVIIDDLLLISYTEAAEMIRGIECQKK